MFCPKCGNPKVVDVFCASCLRELHPLIKGFKESSVKVCTTCKKVFTHGHWHSCDDPVEKIREILASNLVFAKEVDIKRVVIEPPVFEMKSGLKVSGEATVHVTGRASKRSVIYEEEYLFPYEIQNTFCTRCGKIGSQYYEGTLQVRNETPESRKFLKEYLKTTSATVAKFEAKGTGTDYCITSKRVIELAARELQQRFGGTIKSSAQLFSRNHLTSKDIWRPTWFVELAPFKVGDAVKNDNSCLFVVELAKKIKFYNPARSKYEFHEYKDFTWERLSVVETTVSFDYPDVKVIHPETFQQVRVWNNAPHEHKIGDRVKVCVDGQKVYLYDVGKQE